MRRDAVTIIKVVTHETILTYNYAENHQPPVQHELKIVLCPLNRK